MAVARKIREDMPITNASALVYSKLGNIIDLEPIIDRTVDLSIFDKFDNRFTYIPEDDEYIWNPEYLENLRQYVLDGGEPYESFTVNSFPVLRSLEPYDTHRQPRQGRCWLFDGVNDFATRGARLTSGSVTALTACAWVKTTTTTLNFLLGESEGLNDRVFSVVIQANGKIAFQLNNNGTSTRKVYISSVAVNDGTWKHLSFTWSSGVAKLYINGVEDTSVFKEVDNSFTTLANASANFAIGAGNSQSTPAAFFNGSLRDVRVFSTAKTAGEILAIKNGDDDATGLLAHYPCNEESGTTGYDISGNGNHLTLTNITQGTFHATDTAVTSNRNNADGYRFANNLVLRSEELNLSPWSVGAASIVGNDTTGPFGETIAEKLTPVTADTFHNIKQPYAFIANQPVTFSIYAKSNGYNIWLQLHDNNGTSRYFDLTAGTSENNATFALSFGAGQGLGGSIENVGNGWFRCVISGIVPSGTENITIGVTPNNSTPTYAGDGTSGVFLWGAQLETGTSVGDYYPTTTATFPSVYIPKRLSDANAADGNALTVTGQSPYPINVEVPCVAGDGSTVYCDLGSPLIPATADFEVECWYYVDGLASPKTIFFQGNTAASQSAALTANFNGSSYSSGKFSAQMTGASGGGILSSVDLVNLTWNRVGLRRVGSTLTLHLNGATVGSTSFAGSAPQTNIVLSAFLNGGIATANNNGRITDLRITTGGVTTYFPLQDGPGSSNTNRDLSYIKSDGTYGVISDAIVNGTVSTIWTNRCPYAEDWSVNYGGDIAANGAFLPGQISGSLAADGTAKTLEAGKFGNSYSRVNFNPFTAAELNGLGAETAYAVGAHGLLTNMDAATDWVADTDAGGVRALDFDGVDDRVLFSTLNLTANASQSFSICVWTKLNTTSSTQAFFSTPELGVNGQMWRVSENLIRYRPSVGVNLDFSVPNRTTDWELYCLINNGGTLRLFINTVESSSGSVVNTSAAVLSAAGGGGAATLGGKLDDIRIFNQALDADDITYLYNGGTGRGIVSSNYAVNGKVPVAAWIPSRDTVGNGTLRLTNLVGTARQTVSPADTKFRRTAAAGDDRLITTSTALTGTDKTNTEGYVA